MVLPLIIVNSYVGYIIASLYLVALLFAIFKVLNSNDSILQKVLWTLAFIFIPFLFVFYLISKSIKKKSVES